jgi:carboxyl-terminal processing protease
MPLRNLAWLLVVPAIVALGLAISYSAPAPDRDYQRVRQVVDVMAEVDANFYRKLTDKEWQQFVEAMINGGLHELDPHSEYFNAEQLKQFEADSEGSFGGVGIILTIDPATKFLKVGHPIPETPAYDAGIIAGDLIVKVGDKSTEGITVTDAAKIIKGEPGTKVTLTIRRAGRNPTDGDVELVRGRIPQHPVSGVKRRSDDLNRWEWTVDKDAGIALVRVGAFNDLTTKEIKAAIEEIEKEGGKGLILDLRENPGGLLNQAIDVSNLFLPGGASIVSTRGRDPDRTRDFKAKKDVEIWKGKPVVVLINDGSASASEIVSSALQDNQRATIVGERSYGKGSVQKLLRLQAGEERTAVKLTTETYWRPSNKNMDRRLAEREAKQIDDPAKRAEKMSEWGVTPDVEVATTKDEKLRAAAELLKAHWVAGKPSVVGPNPPPAPTPLGPDGKPVVDDSKPFEDRPLKAGIDVLKKKIIGAGNARPLPRIPMAIAG